MLKSVIGFVIAVSLFLVAFVVSNSLLNQQQAIVSSLTNLPNKSKMETETIELIITNDYEPIASLVLYPWDHIAEPYVTSTLTASIYNYDTTDGTFSWTITYQHKGDGVDITALEAEGESVEAVFTHAGQAYTVTIEYVDDQISVSTQISVMCKYVRRELRALSDSDRESFFNALEIVYTVDLDEGRSIYGDTYRNHQYFTIKHVGLNRCNPFHGATAFLTSHAAFTLELEKSLQLVEPAVTVPYWDYTYENLNYGQDWDESIVFTDDWFGTTQPDNSDYVLDTGRFAYTLIPTSYERPVYNSYGRITSRVNNDPSEYITRSHSVCGIPTNKPLPDCNGVLGCFKMTSLHELHKCLELDVHSYFHLMIGGAWDCPFGGKTIQEEVPKMNSSIVLILYNSMNLWTALHEIGYIVCPNFCSTDTPYSECACSSPKIDAMLADDSLDDDAITTLLFEINVFNWLELFLSDINVDYDTESVTFDGLTDEENVIFRKWLLLFITHPGKTGSMGTNGAPNDPLFWPIHPTFDRLFTFMRLAPAFDSFNFTWVADGTCYGNGFYDLLPFSDLLNEGNNRDYSNQQLYNLFDPANPELPYLYDTFEWINCYDAGATTDDFMAEVLRQSKGILPHHELNKNPIV